MPEDLDLTALRLVACPDCAAPAEIADRSIVGSTIGPMEVVRVRCVRRHQFLMPSTKLVSL